MHLSEVQSLSGEVQSISRPPVPAVVVPSCYNGDKSDVRVNTGDATQVMYSGDSRV